MDRIPHLVGVRGPLKGRRYRVTASGVVLGRAPGCDVPIPDPGVSREHARVLLHNSAVWVQDAGSRNGVFVNGKRVVRHKQLGLGSELVIGDHSFTLQLFGEGVAESPEARLPELPDGGSGKSTVEVPGPSLDDASTQGPPPPDLSREPTEDSELDSGDGKLGAGAGSRRLLVLAGVAGAALIGACLLLWWS